MPTAWRVLIMAAGLMLTISCASITQPPDVSFTPSPNTAVIYGRFLIRQNQEIPGFCLDIYREDSQQELLVPFRHADPDYCVVSEGGPHDLIGVMTINFVHRGVRYLFRGPDGLHAIPFEVKPGTATYVGDIAGACLTAQFGVTSISNNFAEATRTFREKYPRLASLPVQSIFDQTNLAIVVPSIPTPMHIPPTPPLFRIP